MKKPYRLGMLENMNGILRWSMVGAAAVALAACAGNRRAVAVEPAASGHGGRATVVPARVHSSRGSYRVVKGDTLYSIAFRNGVDFRDLARWNGIDSPYTIWPGQELRLSPSRRGATHAPVTRHATHVPVAAATAAHTTGSSSTVVVPVAGAGAGGPVDPAPVATPVHTTGAARSTDGISWRWPADGTLIKRFQSGDAIPGIELAGRSGDPVRAAADGVVVYSGNGLVGYGELIIIKHNDSFLSAYGHNRKRLVKEGQRVSAGQEIAEMGSTGASRDELQFQVRRNGNPVDPLNYLPPR
jgi:lipoprotein NlpD